MLVSLISYCQYPMTKTIGKDSVVIITTQQAETINKVHTKMLDSIKLVRLQATMTAYDKLEALDKIEDLENRVDIYKYQIKNKDLQIQSLSAKKRSPFLFTMILLVGWTLYTGIHTQTIK